jgi:hypothetical protein
VERDEDLEEKMEAEEAKSRQVFDPIEKTFDYRKKRVTDLTENSRVTLPKPLPISEEAGMETRRKAHMAKFNTYKEENCNQWGDQDTNLTEDESRGLKSLQKRIKNKEILILKTDKTGKLAVADRETYLEIGKLQIQGDIEIDRKEIRRIEKVLNSHSAMWCKFNNMGEAHNHKDRIWESKQTKSENLANMYLTVKDHKESLAWRKVVSGCDSDTLGLSNSVSELLEAVCNSLEEPYEVISSEDMLACVVDCNRRLETIRREKLQAGEALGDQEKLVMCGNDVVGLFPNITSARTGKIVRYKVEESKLRFEGMNFKQVSLYVYLNQEKTGDLSELRRFFYETFY